MRWIAISFFMVILFMSMSALNDADLFYYSVQTADVQGEIIAPVQTQMGAMNSTLGAAVAGSGSPWEWVVGAHYLLQGMWIGIVAFAKATIFLPFFLTDIGCPAGIALMLSGVMWVTYALGILQLLGKWPLKGGYA